LYKAGEYSEQGGLGFFPGEVSDGGTISREKRLPAYTCPVLYIPEGGATMEKRIICIADRDTRFILKAVDALIDTFELYVAYTRDDAFHKIKRDLPDLIIIGYLYPRGDSFRLHQQLREDDNTKHIPHLFVDVKPEEHLRKGLRRNEGMQMDAEGYITRPVYPGELKKEAGRIINKAIQRNKALTEALELTETLLMNQAENWKNKMTQLMGKNRIVHSA
jgi:PleD family two-component response regulator